jgi:hypothetical protein
MIILKTSGDVKSEVISDNAIAWSDASFLLTGPTRGERMLVQPRLPHVLAPQPRQRSVRRPFHPSRAQGAYRLPYDVHDRLTTALASFRNRDAAFALAVFLARFWSTPDRIVDAFPIDRRALADHPDLGLSEKRVRNAIQTLEAVGFIDRDIRTGSTHIKTDDGELWRKPIKYRFGSDYGPMFGAANRRAAAVRGRRSVSARPQVAENARRASPANFRASPLKGPKATGVSESSVLMGPLVKESGLPPKSYELDPKLEAALEQLRQGVFGRAGAGKS